MSRSDAGVLDWLKNGVLAFKAFDARSLGHCRSAITIPRHSETEIRISEPERLKFNPSLDES